MTPFADFLASLTIDQATEYSKQTDQFLWVVNNFPLQTIRENGATNKHGVELIENTLNRILNQTGHYECLTEDQIKWASTHDWYIAAQDYKGGFVVICKDYSQPLNVAVISCFKTLREWAGY